MTSGGRVMCIVGEQRASVYAAAERVAFPDKQFRRDIGLEVNTVAGATR